MKRIVAVLAAILGFGLVPMLMGPSGGYPAFPTFQTVTANQAATSTARNVLVQNPTSGTTAAAQLTVQNDTLSSSHELEFGLTSSAFSGAFLTGGPTGQSGFINTSDGSGICIGTNNVCRLSVGAAGPVTMNGVTTGTALTVTGVGTSGIPAMLIQGNTGTGLGDGLNLQAGTNSSDYAIRIANAGNSSTLFEIQGDGGMTTGALADKGNGTLNAAGLYVSGLQVPKFTYGLISQTAPTTCATAGTVANIASVSCTVSGVVTINFTSAYTNAPFCVANLGLVAGMTGWSAPNGTTNAILNTFNSSGAAAQFSNTAIICVGI